MWSLSDSLMDSNSLFQLIPHPSDPMTSNWSLSMGHIGQKFKFRHIEGESISFEETGRLDILTVRVRAAGRNTLCVQLDGYLQPYPAI
jgi:hypothetical protein